MPDFNPLAIIGHIYTDGSSKIKVIGFDGEGNQRVSYVDVDDNNNDGDVTKTMNKSKWNRKNYQDLSTGQGGEGSTNSVHSDSNRVNTLYSIEVDENGQLVIRNSDGMQIITENIKGPKGQSGEIGPQGPIGPSGNDGLTWAPRITEDGLSLYFVNNRGERTTSYRFKGDKGENGAQGPAGPTGQSADLWKPQITPDGKQMFFVNQNGEETEKYNIQGIKGDRGETGATGPVGPEGPVFIPSVNSDGEISWSNNGNLPNPTPINIRGSKGENGENGAIFHPVIIDGYLTWTNDKGLPNPDPVKITGPQGLQGDSGQNGKSAYQLWLEEGNIGTKEEFLASLKGEKGDAAEVITTSYEDVTDFKCKVQKIDTNLIVDSDEPTQSPEQIIEERIQEIKDLRTEGHKPHNQENYRVGWFKKCMWWCAGADRDLLTMCPGDHSKYVGVGTVILFTALMAWFSSFIAMRLVFGVANDGIWNLGSLGAAIFALFWGCMIFFLDRFITNTMYSDGKVTISKQEFFSGLPRITIAIFLGIVISAPLELIIFDKEIKSELRDERESKAIVHVRHEEAHKNDTLAIITAEGIEKDLREQYNKTVKHPNDSAYYVTKNHTVSAGQKPAQYRDIETGQVKTRNVSAGSTVQTTKEYNIGLYREQCSRDSNNLAKAIENTQLLRQRLANTDSILLKSFMDSIDVEVSKQGLYANLHALHIIATKDYESWSWCGETLDTILHAWWWYLFNSAIGLIMLLFILIDISPVLYKMMLADGKYDNYLHQEKLLAQDKIRLSLSKMLRKLDDSELKRVAPFIMGDIYEKMAGDSYVFKTEEEFQAELANLEHKSGWWKLWPLSVLRWIFWKEETRPTAPVIIMEPKSNTYQQEQINQVNEAVFDEVLDMKRRIILASYRRWYKRQHDNILGDRVDDDNAGRPPFDDVNSGEE